MRSGSSATRLSILLVALGAATLPAGCYYPGGPLYSADRFTYESTPWQPWTVTLFDTRTGEAVWSVDVPVGEQVVVGFSQGTGPNEYKPDEMIWQLMPLGERFGTLANRMPCPPVGARRLEPTLRPVPESDMSGEPRPLTNRGNRVVQPIGEPRARTATPTSTSAPATTSQPATTSTPSRSTNGPAVLPPATIPPQPAPAPEPEPEQTAPAPVEPPPAEPAPEPIDIPE